MPPFFPHPPYAEDQPLAKTLLSVHVLHRGFQSGAVIALPIAAIARYTARRRAPNMMPTTPFASSLLRTTGVSALWGTAILSLGLVGRMWGRGDIEWKDRSWRLLENKGQQECDQFSISGTVAGLSALSIGKITGQLSAARGFGGWRVFLGSAAAGNFVGMMVYMVYRHGWKGGKWPDGEKWSWDKWAHEEQKLL